MSTYTDEERENAQKRFMWLQLSRFASLGLLLVGIAITQAALAAPYWLGIVLVVIGFAGFFFAPPLLARKFKARDTHLPDRMDEP